VECSMTSEAASSTNLSPVRTVIYPAWLSDAIDWNDLDAIVLSTLEDKSLRRSLHNMEKLELSGIWILTEKTLSRYKRARLDAIAPLELHERLLRGLTGESLLVSSSMFLDTIKEAERFFHVSFKTIKARLGTTLDTSASELAMRAARATIAAAELLGGFEAARRYLRTRNFALGGSVPLDLLKTAEGERLVLNELHAQAEGGPL
jgi:uncharacterized protein (DUF2384 family)